MFCFWNFEICLFKRVCSEELFQWHFSIFHTLIIFSILSHYLITEQLVLSLNSLICLCEIQSFLSWRYYPPHFTEPAIHGYQPLRFFLMHNIFSNQYPEQNYPWYHTESIWSKIFWHDTFLCRKMSAHLNILLKRINFDGISLKVGKHTTKSISFRCFKKYVSLWNEYFNHLCVD